MLKQISCDKFLETPLIFHKGLNAVIGDELASNSIGKSTILMIIDFAFGGDTYITANKDCVENLGHHEFKIMYEFGEEKLFFIRSTSKYKFITVCDKNYLPINEISIKEYTDILKEKYRINLSDISFRNIIGRYARVYGKANLNEKKPLQYFEKESVKDEILTLIKLFNKYSSIKEYESQIKNLSEEKDVLKKAITKEFIPTVNKTIFKNNNKKIMELNVELDELKKEVLDSSVDLESVMTKEILELRKEKSELIRQKNICEMKLKRTENNLKKKKLNLGGELEKLIEFFPNVNIEKLETINNFHNSLSKVLEDELKKVKKELKKKLDQYLIEINNIDKQISEKLDIKDVPKYQLDKVIDITTQIQILNNTNDFYNKKEAINSDLKSTKSDLAEIKLSITNDISNKINKEMDALNKLIYKDNRRSPNFNINGDDYTFNTVGDTGTGTAYANLITFDLAILKLTCLPAIIHDLPLLKNIQNEALDNIVKIYQQSEKQIFIAIDKIQTYGKNTVKILEENSFLKLSNNKVLFILNWKNKVD